MTIPSPPPSPTLFQKLKAKDNDAGMLISTELIHLLN